MLDGCNPVNYLHEAGEWGIEFIIPYALILSYEVLP